MAIDVEVKEVNGGSKVSSFILAVDRNAEEADFFRIKAWNSQAEANSGNSPPPLATDVDVKEVNGGSKVSSFILAMDWNAEEARPAILQPG